MGEPGDEQRIRDAAQIAYENPRDPQTDPNVVKYNDHEYRAKTLQRLDLLIDAQEANTRLLGELAKGFAAFARAQQAQQTS